MKTMILTSLLSIASTVMTNTAQARPEYAAKTQASCSSCHSSPWGGGPRTIYGKMFGARNLGTPKTNGSDIYYGDFRSLLFVPKTPVQSSSGMVIMEAAATANVPITEDEDGSEMHVVGTYNFSPLSSGAREAYIHWKVGADENRLASHILIGRFNSPFGLLTDEHRTYTRMLTNSSLNTFNTGLAVSGEPIQTLHYDFALVNNLQGGAGFNNQDIIWADVFNLRWTPAFFPGIIGVSQNFQHAVNQAEPFAFSAYTVLSLDRLTKNKINGSLSGEVVTAKNWISSKNNPSLGSFFVPAADSAYQDATSSSRSLGYYFQAKYDLNSRWSLIYKYDYLLFDQAFQGDGFSRHGLGFEVFINSNVILNARVEKASVGRSEIASTNALAAEDDILMMLRLWI